jgi:hypothetical protein
MRQHPDCLTAPLTPPGSQNYSKPSPSSTIHNIRVETREISHNDIRCNQWTNDLRCDATWRRRRVRRCRWLRAIDERRLRTDVAPSRFSARGQGHDHDGESYNEAEGHIERSKGTDTDAPSARAVTVSGCRLTP